MACASLQTHEDRESPAPPSSERSLPRISIDEHIPDLTRESPVRPTPADVSGMSLPPVTIEMILGPMSRGDTASRKGVDMPTEKPHANVVPTEPPPPPPSKLWLGPGIRLLIWGGVGLMVAGGIALLWRWLVSR